MKFSKYRLPLLQNLRDRQITVDNVEYTNKKTGRVFTDFRDIDAPVEYSTVIVCILVT